MKHTTQRLPVGLTMIEAVLTGLLCLAVVAALHVDHITLASILTALRTLAAALTCLLLMINPWQLSKCCGDWKQTGAASPVSVGSWLISIVPWFVGPSAPIVMPLSLILGISSWVNADASPATRRAGRMAVINTLCAFVIILTLRVWATHTPDLRVFG